MAKPNGPLRVVITGASSFTGAWFAARLAGEGHRVIATVQRDPGAYGALETARLAMVRASGATLVGGVTYGNGPFRDLLREGCDALCYHGADVRDYRSPQFDVNRALQANLAGIGETCRTLAANGGRLVYTGSVGEPGEGGGSDAGRALSPYGLSKGLTWQAISREAAQAGVPHGKFVVPNPFGPLEQERFCTYLVHCWARGETPVVRTPDYVRDNIPVDKLARAYAGFVARPFDSAAPARIAPSGYVGSQGLFTARFAREIGQRLGLATPFALATQTDFSEPLIRINTDAAAPGWDEERFWDALAADYAERLLGRSGGLT